jgi:Abnormal spindle-like microcephaly-assoc'd, ASPM-SPD-2-Hydin
VFLFFQVLGKQSGEPNVLGIGGSAPLGVATGSLAATPQEVNAQELIFIETAATETESRPVSEGNSGIVLVGAGERTGATLTSVDFGTVVLGQSATRELAVHNTGTGVLAVSSITSDNDQFSIDSPTDGFTVAPGGLRRVTVRFSPTAVGAQSGVLSIASNDPDAATRTVQLQGVGELGVPDLGVDSLTSMGKPTVNPQGSVEVPIQVVVRNHGNTAAGIFKVATEYTSPQRTFAVAFTVPGQDSLWYPFTKAPLAARSSVTFTGKVTFHPSVRKVIVILRAIADSCRGDEFMPGFCRVNESDEGNNTSVPLTLSLP